jgi:hypothetical protein
MCNGSLILRRACVFSILRQRGHERRERGGVSWLRYGFRPWAAWNGSPSVKEQDRLNRHDRYNENKKYQFRLPYFH